MTATQRVLPPGKILLVDDHPVVRTASARLLSRLGHVVTSAENGAQALQLLDDGKYDLVCSDIQMPGMDGIELLRAIRERDLDVPVVFLTGNPDVQTAMTAIRYGALDYLTKPVDRSRLEQSIARGLVLGRMNRARRAATEDRVGAHGGTGLAGMEAGLARAMKTLWIAYQPILDRDGALYGHEALMRSRDPAFPHPGAVLDAAEQLGALHSLGRHLRNASASPVAAAPSSGWLFVNLHPRDLFDDHLTDPSSPLTSIASRVVLEITERASLDKLEDVRPRIAEVRERGFRIAIDDLGAGYAGLTAFAVLEPDVVKLDMTLVRGIDSSKTKQKLVESLAAVSRDLGMLVVAEGVETDAELDALLGLGCDLVQGFLLARPGPAFPAHAWPRSGQP